MPQHRLEYYFAPSYDEVAPSGRNFLDLPRSVRELVYKYAGLDNLFVDLNYSNLKIYPHGAYPETVGCRRLDMNGCYELKRLDVGDLEEVWEINDPSEDVKTYGKSIWGNAYGVPQSMLLVSKKVHEEVEALIYAEAVFRVCLGQPLGLTRLWRMSDHALYNIATLTIRLDVPRTLVENDAWHNRYDPPSPPTHLDVSKKWGKIILKTWMSTLNRLMKSIKPGQLKLRVIFRAKTLADARAVIEPMVRLPRLKDCGICAETFDQTCWWKTTPPGSYTKYEDPWPRNNDTELARLVQQVIQKLTIVSIKDTAPFRYLDLPQELRFAILEFTDLISPEAVQWRPRRWIHESASCTHCMDFDIRAMDRPPCSCHGSPVINTDEYQQWFQCCGTCNSEDKTGVCYCSSRGQIWSSSCICSLARQALFAVSRQLRWDAMSLYYKFNEILVTPFNSWVLGRTSQDEYWPPDGFDHLPKIELSLYLSSIAREALQHIRRLEWILPNSEDTYLLPQTPAWFDYLDTLLLMENSMKLSALTFTINLSASGMRSSIYHRIYSDRCVHNKHAEDVWKWYETIVLPVRRLGEAGLKDFFVHLRWRDVGEEERKQREKDLERKIMGAGYDSEARGKPLERYHKKCLDYWAEKEKEEGYF